METCRKEIGKINFYDGRVSCDFPYINTNLHLFNMTTAVKGGARTSIKNLGYGFKHLDLISPTKEKLNNGCFQIFYVEDYTSYPDCSDSLRRSDSSILYGILCDEETAKMHCKELAEGKRREEIKELLEDEKRNQGLSEKDREIYGMLEIKIYE